VGKNGSGAEVKTDAEVETEDTFVDETEAPSAGGGVDRGSPGATIPNVSPAPSQSELVNNGVCI
jgi:hypothetical protein